nr:hypothetical protein [Microvirga arabica]
MSAVKSIAALVPAHREGGCLLPPLHLVPERVINDAQMRHRRALPALGRVQACHAFARAWILHIRAAIPYQLTDIELVVEDARTALLLAADGGVLPRAVLRAWDMLLIQSPGDRPRTDPVGEHREDALDHGSFSRVDNAPSSFRVVDHVIAERLAGRSTPLQHPPQLTALGLLAKVGEKHLCHRAEHADMHGGHCTDIDRVQAHAVELQLIVEAGDIREFARQTIERLDDHDIEGASPGLRQKLPIAGSIAAGARKRPILEGGRDLKPMLGRIAPADLDLVFDRGLALVLARVAGIDGGALHARSSAAALSLSRIDPRRRLAARLSA